MTETIDDNTGARRVAAARGGLVGAALAGVLGIVSVTLEGFGLANMAAWMFGAFVLGLLIFPGWACAVALAAVRRRTVTASELRGLAATGAFFFVSVAFGPLSTQARIASLHAVAHQGDAVVAAVEAFSEENGRYPGRLEDLVPELLREIPPTGNAACARFGYDRIEPTSERPWVQPSFRAYVYCADVLDVTSLIWSSEGPPSGARVIGSGWYYRGS